MEQKPDRHELIDRLGAIIGRVSKVEDQSEPMRITVSRGGNVETLTLPTTEDILELEDSISDLLDGRFVEVDLGKLIENAVDKVRGSDERMHLENFLSRNTEVQVVEIDLEECRAK